MTRSIDASAPLVIGGFGGGGTRVYKSIAEVAGYSMLVAPVIRRRSKNMENWHDNLMLTYFFYSKWIDPYLLGQLGRFGEMRMRVMCRALLWLSGPLSYGRHPWGWKNPRAAYLIPFFHELYPNMRFLHVLRDGRDHAYNTRFPYMRHQHCLLKDDEMRLEDPLRKALHWSRLHRLAETSAERHLSGRYLQSRLEDLCTDPEREVRRVLSFLGSESVESIEEASSIVQVPSSIGRWRSKPADQIARIESLIGDDLVRYGYQLSH